jgi:hypothetical protein
MRRVVSLGVSIRSAPRCIAFARPPGLGFKLNADKEPRDRAPEDLR